MSGWHDLVDVVRTAHRRDFEQHVGLTATGSARRFPMDFKVQLRLADETRARPVVRDVAIRRERQQGHLPANWISR